MFPTVRVEQPNRSPLVIVVGEPLIVGRECDGLLLADEKVSRQHLRLSPASDGVVVVDLGSTNGTFVNGERIESTTLLTPGASARLGETIITIEPPALPPAPGPEPETAATATVVATLPQADTPAAQSAGAATLPPGPPPRPPQPAPPPPPPTVGATGAFGESGGVVRPAPSPAASRRTSIDALAASLANSQVDLPSGSADDTVTIMFSDIESSTDLALSMGDEAWYRTLTWHNQTIEGRVAEHGGFIVKNQGDGFMVTFNSARRAIICATEIQRSLADQPGEHPIKVRIGMHTGEAIRQDSGDLFGRHVIIAARIGDAAHGGQIVVSSIVREIAAARGDLRFGDRTPVDLKGLGVQDLYPVIWN